MSKVSAIITTRNRAALLKRAIESVQNQTYKDMECIVVDDDSTDNTREICNQYPVQYIYIPKEESHGGNYARNLGIKASKGKYCAFLDDDDYWLPTKIEKQVQLIEDKGCEMVYCGMKVEYVNENGVTFKVRLPNHKASGDMSRKILQFIATNTSCILVKRTALNDIGLFDEELRFWQEYELTIRLAQRKPFYFVNEPLIVYRQNLFDTHRLTNKYRAWRNAVRLIHQKHALLYSQLSYYERLKVHYMVWTDAQQRCKASGLVWKNYYFKLLTFPWDVFFSIKRFLFPSKS